MKPDHCPMCYNPHPGVLPARRKGGKERYECLQCGWRSDMEPSPEKQWGGAGRNQGPKPKWKSGDTTTIRVPVVLRDEVLDYAHRLDEDERPGDQGSGFASLGDLLISFNDPSELQPGEDQRPGDQLTTDENRPATSDQATRETIAQAIEILQNSLKMVSNKGGAIKVEIREALKLLETI